MLKDVSPRLRTSCVDSQVAWQRDRWYWYFTLANHKTHTLQGASVFTKTIIQPENRVQETSAVQFWHWAYISLSFNYVKCIVLLPWSGTKNWADLCISSFQWKISAQGMVKSGDVGPRGDWEPTQIDKKYHSWLTGEIQQVQCLSHLLSNYFNNSIVFVKCESIYRNCNSF